MRPGFANLAGMMLFALALSGCAHRSDDGWVTLIDGNAGMDNWYVTGSAANWRAEGGAI